MKVVSSLVLLAIALFFSLVAVEFAARQIFDPVDFLMPIVVSDEVLNHRIRPNSGGHDAWGFRNSVVPNRTGIVTIGDSMTYGQSAPMTQNWPSHLDRRSPDNVYNLGLGGYGPLQYLQLLREKATSLKPHTVIVAFYVGNDLLDAEFLAQSSRFWADWRTPKQGPSELTLQVNQQSTEEKKFAGKLRTLLAERSVMYRLLTQSVLGDYSRMRQRELDSIELWIRMNNGQSTSTYLRPNRNLAALDLDNESTESGLTITLRAFREIRKICEQAGIRLFVVIIPTKERVYHSVIPSLTRATERQKLLHVVDLERKTVDVVVDALGSIGIETIDVLSALQSQHLSAPVYPTWDDHPNSEGYKVIASTVAAALYSQSTE